RVLFRSYSNMYELWVAQTRFRQVAVQLLVLAWKDRSVFGNLDPKIAARLKFNADGLVCAVVQQFDTREVLMVGWMNAEALHQTLTTGRTVFWSRSRQQLWRKGDTSGHVQWVKGVRHDCDGEIGRASCGERMEGKDGGR